MNFCLFMDTQPKNVSGRTALFSALTALLAKLFYDIAGLGSYMAILQNPAQYLAQQNCYINADSCILGWSTVD